MFIRKTPNVSQRELNAVYIKDYMQKNNLSYSSILNQFGHQQSRIPLEQTASNQASDVVTVDEENPNKALSNQILFELNNTDMHDKFNAVDEININLKLITLDLRSVNAVYKDFNDYRFWLNLSQTRMQLQPDGSGKFEDAIDYLKNGIRNLPLNSCLLYNFACVNEKIGNFGTAIKFFGFLEKLRPKWVDSLYGMAVSFFRIGNYKTAKQIIKKAIIYLKNNEHEKNPKSHNEEYPNLENLDVLIYFRATCYKNLGKFDKSFQDYKALKGKLYLKQGHNMMKHLISIILLPLMKDRRQQFDIVDYQMQLMREYQRSLNEKSTPLTQYVHKDGTLNMKRGGCLRVCQEQPFLNRFDKESLAGFLSDARVKYFEQDDTIFLSGKVGIITSGSVHLLSHSKDIMNPEIIGKFGAGRILGHRSDEGLTKQSDTWIVNYENGTEIVFFSEHVFEEMWNMQNLIMDKEVIKANIQCNHLLGTLSEQTLNYLIFEAIQIRRYKPGQLICRMSKRSKLNNLYKKLYEVKKSKMADAIEQKIQKQHIQEIAAEEKITEGRTMLTDFIGAYTSDKKELPKRSSMIMLEPTPMAAKEGQGQTNTSFATEASNNKAQAQPMNSPIAEEAASFEKDYQSMTMEQVLVHFDDPHYKEVDGLYIIYQGHVDILSQTQPRELVHTLNVFDHFGDSLLLKKSSFEYIGDMYAGNTKNKGTKSQMGGKLRKMFTKKEQQLDKEPVAPTEPKIRQHGRSLTLSGGVTQVPDIIGQIHESNAEDTICLFIPLFKLQQIPKTELEKLCESEQTTQTYDPATGQPEAPNFHHNINLQKNALFQVIAQKYKMDIDLIQTY